MKIPNIEEPQLIPLHRHGDVGRIFKAFGFEPGECKILEQGFIDNTSKFYSRREAAEYVIRNNQRLKNDKVSDYLYSEDLY